MVTDRQRRVSGYMSDRDKEGDILEVVGTRGSPCSRSKAILSILLVGCFLSSSSACSITCGGQDWDGLELRSGVGLGVVSGKACSILFRYFVRSTTYQVHFLNQDQTTVSLIKHQVAEFFCFYVSQGIEVGRVTIDVNTATSSKSYDFRDW